MQSAVSVGIEQTGLMLANAWPGFTPSESQKGSDTPPDITPTHTGHYTYLTGIFHTRYVLIHMFVVSGKIKLNCKSTLGWN